MTWGLRSSRTVVIGTALSAFVVCSVLPLVYMVGFTLFGSRGTSATFAALLLDPRQRTLLFNTTLLGGATAIGATLIGAPLGVALARVPLPFKGALRIALAAPVLLPPYVMGLAWIHLGGSTGVVAQLIGRPMLSEWTYSMTGTILVLSLVFFPLSMLTTEVAVRRVESRLEEAALLVAPPRQVLRRITLPLAAPGIAAATLVVFVLAISEFGVPGLLRVPVFTTEVFTAFAALYDFGRATVIGLPLLVLAAGIAAAAAALLGDRFVTTRRGSASVESPAFDAWTRPALAVAACVLLVALILPVAVLAHEAWGITSIAAVVQDSGEAVRNSLVMSALGACAVTAVAVWLGYARARAPRRLGLAGDVIFVVLFAVPSTVIGVGMIGVWNRPGLAGEIYGTVAMLVLVYLARFVPVAALALAASAGHVSVSQEEAAAVAGAGWLRTMIHIVLPQMKLGIIATSAIVFILIFGELGASLLVAPPGDATLPIRIYTLIANTPSAHVAALALLQATVIFCPVALLGLVVAFRGGR